MNLHLRIFILLCGIIFDIIIVNLLVKKKISEKSSIVWFTLSILIFILSAFPGLLDAAAGFVGIDYPPTLLFLLSILMLFFMALSHYIQLSAINSRLKEVAQQVAIINFRLKAVEEKLDISDKNYNIAKGNDFNG